ncbi:hypothetical protein HMI54_005861 [Coelomomyces lativittatus]|nr:hypothetical protein HMI55_000714 [Coelomomyces lativittatus]KAJ1514861.1 hypothetical protein HMI56_007223 [Coelomomyces lativittatus]KAJ1517363.1 hypothetical protein HMI54_005861 [Coelomomyces lativittatus]
MSFSSSNIPFDSEAGKPSDSLQKVEVTLASENFIPLPIQSLYFNPQSEFFDIDPNGDPVFLPRPTPIQKFVSQLRNLDYKKLLKKKRRRPSEVRFNKNEVRFSPQNSMLVDPDTHDFEMSDIESTTFSFNSDEDELEDVDTMEDTTEGLNNANEEDEEYEEVDDDEENEEHEVEEEVELEAEPEGENHFNDDLKNANEVEFLKQSIKNDHSKMSELQPSSSQLNLSQQTIEPLEAMRERVNRHLEIACHEIWALKQIVHMLLETPPPSQPPSTDPPYFKKAIHPIPFPKPDLPIKQKLDDLAYAYGSKQAHLRSAANILRSGAKLLSASIQEEANFLIQAAVPLRNRFWRMGLHPNGGVYVDYAFDSYYRVIGRAEIHRVFTHPSKKEKEHPNCIQISPRLQLYFQPQWPSICSIEVTFHPMSTSSPHLPRLFPPSHSLIEKHLRKAQRHLNQKQLFLKLCDEATKVPQVTVKDDSIVLFLGQKGSVHISLTKKPLTRCTPETLLLQHMSLSAFSDWVLFNAYASDIFQFLFPLLRRIHKCTPLDFSHTLIKDVLQFKIVFLTSKSSLELTLQSPTVLTVRVLSGRHVVLFHPKQVIPLLQHQLQSEIVHVFKLFIAPSAMIPLLQVHLSPTSLSVNLEGVATINKFTPGWIGKLVLQLGL